jgi:hypothetical protein
LAVKPIDWDDIRSPQHAFTQEFVSLPEWIGNLTLSHSSPSSWHVLC